MRLLSLGYVSGYLIGLPANEKKPEVKIGKKLNGLKLKEKDVAEAQACLFLVLLATLVHPSLT